jgi:hypothetical protein
MKTIKRFLFLSIACAALHAQAARRSDAVLVVLDTSAPLADMAQPTRPPAAWQMASRRPILAAMRGRTPAGIAHAPEAANAQPQGMAAPPMAQVQTGGTRLDFDALAANGNVPANVSGAVGEVHYVLAVNRNLAVYDKEDGAMLLGPIDGNTVFAGLHGTAGAEACRDGDGSATQLHYDKPGQRWIFTRLAWAPEKAAHGPYYVCIAVSISPDPTGGYYRYALNLQGAYTDDLRVSVWNDAYYLSFPAFDGAQGDYLGPRVCAFDRGTALAGSDARLICWDLGSAFGPVVVADIDGATEPPQGSAAYLLSLPIAKDGRGDHLLAWRASFVAGLLGEPLAVPVSPFTSACAGPCVEQPAPGETLAAMGDRFSGRLVYRKLADGEALVATHNVQQGLRWYELRPAAGGALSVYQQGTFAPDADTRWMGSIGMDRAGNIALAYSVSGKTTPPGIRYTGRTRTDPPGRMENEETIVNGTGVQTDSFQRWSAGSALSVDAADDCRFWYAQQYIASSGAFTWRTRIASFAFRNCAPAPQN